MEQNNLETQFKEKLNSREIKPTEMAWDRLNAMLTVAETSKSAGAKQTTKTKFVWLYIAASCIGFLLISDVFFNQKESTKAINKNNVVIENSIRNDIHKSEIKSIKKETDFSKTILKSKTKPFVQTQKSTKTKIENPTFNSQKNTVAEMNTIDQSILNAEHRIGKIENIDSLLATVQLNQKSRVKNQSLKINSVALLHQVDGELQVSFREKALNTITQKFKEARESVANRNNQ